MNPSGYLELAIAFVFIILLLSLLVSGINEIFVYAFNTRGKFLKEVIAMVFKDKNKNFTEALYDHPMIDSLKKNQKSLPAYISSGSFADTIIELIGNEYEKKHERIVQNPETLEEYVDDSKRIADPYKRFVAGIKEMQYSDLKILLRNIAENSADTAELKKNLSKWYDEYMDRASGWYKSKIQLWLFIIGFGVAVFMNVDSFRLLSDLKRDNVLSSKLADAAQGYIAEHSQGLTKPDSLVKIIGQIDKSYQMIDAYDLPIGWEKIPDNKSTNLKELFIENELNWMTPFGWAATAALLSFGSPFWFELLNKLINLRKSGKKPEVAKPKEE